MQVWVFFMEVAMCLLFGVLWLLTYPNGPDGPSTREVSISRNYTFIVNGALAGVAMVGVQGGIEVQRQPLLYL